MSRQLVRVSAFVIAATFVVLGAPAHAGDGGPPSGQFSGSPDGDSSATIGGTQTTTHTTPGTTGSTGSTGSTGTGSTGTGPLAPTTGSTTTDPLAALTGGGACDPATYGPGGYAPGWPVPAPCIQPTPGTPAKPAKPGKPPAPTQITTQMVTDAARVVAPTSTPHVEPGNRSYVNIPNNYWTEAPTVRTSITVLGQAIPLTWTPTGTTWDFGDGSSATGTGVAEAAPGAAGSIEHAYLRQGSYAITTATTYDLTFVLPGQGAQTITLTSPPSPPVTLPVSEIQTRVSYAQ